MLYKNPMTYHFIGSACCMAWFVWEGFELWLIHHERPGCHRGRSGSNHEVDVRCDELLLLPSSWNACDDNSLHRSFQWDVGCL